MKVGVVFGSRSVEHDVSIVTAHQIMAVLAPRHELVPIYITREGRWLTGSSLNDLAVYREDRAHEVGEEAFIPPVPGYGGLYMPGSRLRGSRQIPLDVVVVAVHGTFGEDGTLQGLLELADVPYTGSGVVASAVGFDKEAMKSALRSAGLPVVEGVVVEGARLERELDAVVAEIERAVGYPAFVKPVRAGSSVGIARATDREGLNDALEIARRYDVRVLVEPAMEGCIEVNCSVLGGHGRAPRVSVCEQPVAWEEFLSFSDKYLRSGKGAKAPEGMATAQRQIPAPIPDELTKQIQENALEAFRAVGASGVARIDSFVKESTGETWIMEINTMPGSFSFYLWEATGLSFEDLAGELIDIALAAHEAKSSLMFTFESGMLSKSGGLKAGG